MRKFIFSGPMIGVLVTGWNTLRATKKKPNDWRVLLTWISWALSVAIAVGDVRANTEERSRATRPRRR